MSISFENENQLIQELKSGNKNAYTFLFKTYYKPLCIYCFSLTDNNTFSEDIVQNTFVKLWSNRDDLKIHTSLKSYLYKSVYNSFINEYVRLKRKSEVLDAVYYNALNKTVEQDQSVLKEKLILVDKAIENLPKKSKAVFILNKKEGYSYEEIAKILSISKNTVENHMSSALKKIRKSIIPLKKLGYFFISLFNSTSSSPS